MLRTSETGRIEDCKGYSCQMGEQSVKFLASQRSSTSRPPRRESTSRRATTWEWTPRVGHHVTRSRSAFTRLARNAHLGASRGVRMSDDDYFGDDFILDDQALAQLDQAESQYVATQRAPSRPPPPAPPRLPPPPAQRAPPPRPIAQPPTLARPPPNAGQPPAKRQKVASGWAAPAQARPVARVPSLDDIDMPEIRVDGGFYGAPASQSQMSSSQMSQADASMVEAPSFAAIHTSTPSSAAYAGGRMPQPSQPVAGPSLQRQPTRQNSFNNVRSRQTSYNGPSQQQRRGSPVSGAGGRTLSRSQSHPSPLGSQSSQRRGSMRESIIQTIRASQALRPVEEDLNVADLKRQLEQVCAQAIVQG